MKKKEKVRQSYTSTWASPPRALLPVPRIPYLFVKEGTFGESDFQPQQSVPCSLRTARVIRSVGAPRNKSQLEPFPP